MIENLEKLVREQAGPAIVNNSEVPNEKNEAAIQAASTSIVETLKQKLYSGDLTSLAGLFSPDRNSDATVQDVSANYSNKLQGLGINSSTAKSIAAMIIPLIISQFTKKTNDPNDSSFNLQDIVKTISGPDGKFQLSDLTNMLGNGNNQDPNQHPDQKTDSGSGGLLDNLKGMFK